MLRSQVNLNKYLGVSAPFLEWQVYKRLVRETWWSHGGGSKKDKKMYTILLTTPEYHNLLCERVERRVSKKIPSRSSPGVTRAWRNTTDTSNVYSLNSRDLRIWFSMISSRIFKFLKVMVKSRQVMYPSLPDPGCSWYTGSTSVTPVLMTNLQSSIT